MKRKFEPFDAEKINKEFWDLPSQDRAALMEAMSLYQQNSGIGYQVKNYGKGLEMITDSGSAQGRCLFFTRTPERFIALLVYKKESQKLPKRIESTARERLNEYKRTEKL